MVNDGVPLPVIQRLFDHASITMTAHYAQLHDETLRREITRWLERVNIRGERIALPLDGPLEEAAWMKERIARAKQALPNGYCGLPLVQTCPHPNGCLSCDNFLTDGSFRTVHEQRAGTRGPPSRCGVVLGARSQARSRAGAGRACPDARFTCAGSRSRGGAAGAADVREARCDL